MAARCTNELVNEERLFRIEELFFSITDPRGVILHRNDVFTRISGYSTAELIGAPHSILRHPDMPRVVFKLLWDTIEAGQTIAAYVKNLAKDGRYYWVMAVVMPSRDGYLSIRLKPSSPLFPVVQKLYGELLSIEQAIESEPKRRPEAMQASAARLMEALKVHGFRDYQAFMQTALSTEMVLRQQQTTNQSRSIRYAANYASHLLPATADESGYRRTTQLRQLTEHCAQLDSSLQDLFLCLDEFREMNVMLLNKSQAMLGNANSIRFLSMNATVAAHRIGTHAQTLGVVAESLGDVSVQSERAINELTGQMNSLVENISELIFDVAAIKLQSEVSLHFLDEQSQQTADLIEATRQHDDVDQSLNSLFEEIRNRLAVVYDRLSKSETSFSTLRKCVEQLLRHTNTLRFVQFAGLKESVTIQGADAFRIVFEQAKGQIDKTRQDCDELCQHVEANQRHIHAIRDARHDVLNHTAALM